MSRLFYFQGQRQHIRRVRISILVCTLLLVIFVAWRLIYRSSDVQMEFKELKVDSAETSKSAKGLLQRKRMYQNDSDWNERVIMISIDGFRPDYLRYKEVVTLNSIAREGLVAPFMIPIFPSVTFPNHFSLVTGVYPDVHGIVSNEFYDPVTDDFFSYHSDRQNLSKWWLSEPIWNTVQRYGKTSGVSFWPGSDALIENRRPNWFKAFRSNYTNLDHMDDILTWIDMPSSSRPSFMAAYFGNIDSAAHLHGIDSPEFKSALVSLDQSFKYLIQGMIKRGIYDKINLIIVSDHGMNSVDRDGTIRLEEMVDKNRIFHMDICGAVTAIRPKTANDTMSILKILETESKNGTRFKVYNKTSLKQFNYGDNERIAPIVLVCEKGYYIMKSESKVVKGDHGYDINSTEMRALFIARGPKINSKAKIEPFCNLEVYPLIMDILAVPPRPGNYNRTLSRVLLKQQ